MISVLVAAVLAALLATQGAAAQAILLEGARVVAGDGSPPIENAALLVEGGIISRIGRKGDIALPAGGTRIGLDGKTMMPAIISTHVHPGFQKGLTYLAENFARETIMDDLNRERYFGISTAMSLGIERGDVMFQIRADQAEGRAGGAQLLLAGRGIGAPGAGPGNPIYANFVFRSRWRARPSTKRTSTGSRPRRTSSTTTTPSRWRKPASTRSRIWFATGR
jgi:hypothetical protein